MIRFLFPLLVFFTLCTVQGLKAQHHETDIRALRMASNEALKSYDHEKVLSFLTEDVLTTTGAGTLLSGKEALRSYIAQGGDSQMYWIRTPSEISVNDAMGLAWETGSWKGYDPAQGPDPVIGGRYSAQWTRKSGTWKITSQLFVTLE